MSGWSVYCIFSTGSRAVWTNQAWLYVRSDVVIEDVDELFFDDTDDTFDDVDDADFTVEVDDDDDDDDYDLLHRRKWSQLDDDWDLVD